MKKLFKRIAVICMSAIMMTNLFGTIAFATTGTTSVANSTTAGHFAIYGVDDYRENV